VLALLFAVVALLIVPLTLSGFWIRLVTHMLMFAILASALNIIAGLTGYAAFGNMLFFGLGAYTTAVLMNKAKLSFYIAFPFAGLVAVAAAVLFGLLFLRLRSQYFALATMGASEGTRRIIDNLTSLTGGAQGTTIPSLEGSPEFLNVFFYFAMFFLLILITIVVWRLSVSRLGYALKAIRADEEAASVMGINTTFFKVVSWSLSALFTGLTGSVYAFWFSYIEPPTVFNVFWVVKMFVIMLIGGIGTVFGPIIGAFLLEFVSEVVWSQFLNLHLGVLGLIIVAVVIFMPNGLLGLSTSGTGLRGVVKLLRPTMENRV
jgi:branched-chain amino acid transport system permease protein